MQLKVEGTKDYYFLATHDMPEFMVIASLAMLVLVKSFARDNIKFEDSKHSNRVVLLVHASGWLTTRDEVSSYLKSVP